MTSTGYLMESETEAIRLDKKTDPVRVRQQADWAGLEPGMRVADLGCGSGKTSYLLNQYVQPDGKTIGIDISEQRIDFARTTYKADNLRFVCRDIRDSLEDIGPFDFIWIRFVLEYYLKESFDMVTHISKFLSPGGTLCLIDLDYNCLNHFGLSPNLESALQGAMHALEERGNFDPYVGRKLYAYIYDLGFENIEVNMTAHHLIYGRLTEGDALNWKTKVEIAGRRSGYAFLEYANGFDGFMEDFNSFFNDPRRFTYTPVIACKGRKPL